MTNMPRSQNLLGRLLALAWLLASSSCMLPMTAQEVDFGAYYVNGELALSYQHDAFDPQRARATCKVYHHVHAPDGRLLTKGLGGQFEHHRGLFFGFHQTRAGAQLLDFWHCRNGESQRHRAFVDASEHGLDASWSVAAIDWLDREERTVVHEHRAVRVRAFDAATWCIDVHSELSATATVELGGDPQHSGHQFRALDRFAPKDQPKVTYVRPETAMAQPNDIWTGCDWIAAVLPFADDEGGPVTVIRVEGRNNPTDVSWSTRDYGRFGATFAHTLQPGSPLIVRYHYIVALGSLLRAQCSALAARGKASN